MSNYIRNGIGEQDFVSSVSLNVAFSDLYMYLNLHEQCLPELVFSC